MTTQFSKSVSQIITLSKEEANRLRNYDIEPEHILLGIIRFGESRATDILMEYHVPLDTLKLNLEEVLKKSADESLPADNDVLFSSKTSTVMKLSILESYLTKHHFVEPEDVLLGILKDGRNNAATLLKTYGVDYPTVSGNLRKSDKPLPNETKDEYDDDDEILEEDYESSSESAVGSSEATEETPVQKTPFLDKFGIDMTKNAAKGMYDPVIGRDDEILRMEQILCRRKKNNPILIGEPGVGKSAIVEGLAQMISQKKISHILADKRVVQLDMASIVAGTKYRGQFEERMQGIMKEMENSDNIIVFIDEIHTIIGAGSTPGSMDAANLLKPALARGKMQCIGATTIDEYRKNIEKDGALDRRFQKILVNATDVEETLQILKNIKDRYEDHHNVKYTDEALEACVKLTNRYISDRNFPDKAIDALDEAGSRTHFSNVEIPVEIKEQEKLIDEMKRRKNDAVKSQNFELAANYRDKERQLSFQLADMRQRWESQLRANRIVVTADDIANVVSIMSGIPVQRIAQAEGLKLTNLKTNLKSIIIGQDKAIEKTVKAIMRNRVGLKDPNKPIGTFMFLGPTGVGKTYLTKELAKSMFGSEDALIRIDMSEYMEKFSVSRLVGAPPGYVGYDEGGQLTEKVKRKPYSIVLFDEIEKAHSDVFNLLLQIMDEGRLTDSYGATIDFKNTVIIMTSNVGTKQMREFGRGVGFSTSTSMNDQELARNYVSKALNKTFAPEFINRIDEIITFDQLSKESILKIVDIELNKLKERMELLNYHLSVDDTAKQFIAEKGYDVQFGARPLKRAIQNYLEDSISELIVSGNSHEGDTLLATHRSNEDELMLTIEPMITISPNINPVQSAKGDK